MIKLLNHRWLKLRPQCGRNCERTAFTIRTILKYTEFGIIRKPIEFKYGEFATIKPIEFDRFRLKWSNLTTVEKEGGKKLWQR